MDNHYGPALQRALHNPNPLVRGAAAYALAYIGYTEAKPELEAALADPDPDVRVAAKNALQILGGIIYLILRQRTDDLDI